MSNNPDCRDCRFCEPYDAYVNTPMCSARVPRHFTELARLPTGDCTPEGLLYEARKQ